MLVVSWALNPLVRYSDIFEDGWQLRTDVLNWKVLCDAVLVLLLPTITYSLNREIRDQVRYSFNRITLAGWMFADTGL